MTDEETLHISEKVNRYDVKIRRSLNPYATRKAKCYSRKVSVLCSVRADWARTIFLGRIIHYWTTLPGNVNQLVDSKTSCWRWRLHFSMEWVAAELVSHCPHISQHKPTPVMDWSCWTTWPSVLQVAQEITWSDCLWPLGTCQGQLWTSINSDFAEVSLTLYTWLHRICCKDWTDLIALMFAEQQRGRTECLINQYHIKQFMQLKQLILQEYSFDIWNRSFLWSPFMTKNSLVAHIIWVKLVRKSQEKKLGCRAVQYLRYFTFFDTNRIFFDPQSRARLSPLRILSIWDLVPHRIKILT